MAQRWFPTPNGKGRYTLDTANADEWLELMKTANGVASITSVNQRAVQRAKASEPEEDGGHDEEFELDWRRANN